MTLEDVGGVFHLDQEPAAILYSPLGDASAAPSAVIASGKPGGVMLVTEAAARAGAMSQLPLLSRPTCMAIPAAIGTGAVASAGCIGNRTYTDLGDDELYIAAPGNAIERLAAEVATIANANGTITVDGATTTPTAAAAQLTLSGTTINNGTLEAANGGTLSLGAAVTGGMITADSGGRQRGQAIKRHGQRQHDQR